MAAKKEETKLVTADTLEDKKALEEFRKNHLAKSANWYHPHHEMLQDTPYGGCYYRPCCPSRDYAATLAKGCTYRKPTVLEESAAILSAREKRTSSSSSK